MSESWLVAFPTFPSLPKVLLAIVFLSDITMHFLWLRMLLNRDAFFNHVVSYMKQYLWVYGLKDDWQQCRQLGIIHNLLHDIQGFFSNFEDFTAAYMSSSGDQASSTKFMDQTGCYVTVDIMRYPARRTEGLRWQLRYRKSNMLLRYLSPFSLEQSLKLKCLPVSCCFLGPAQNYCYLLLKENLRAGFSFVIQILF